MVDVEIPPQVLEEPVRKFFPTFLEWVADGNAEQVGGSGNISRGATGAQSLTIFTVPENFTLFITSVWLGSDNAAPGAGTATILFQVSSPLLVLLTDNLNLSFASGSHASNSLTMPIKVSSGASVNIQLEMISSGAPTTVIAHGGFTGFILPKKISIR